MRIHLKNRRGLYEVLSYTSEAMYLATKHHRFTLPVSEFGALAGGLWNHGVSEEEINNFLYAIGVLDIPNDDLSEAMKQQMLYDLAVEAEEREREELEQAYYEQWVEEQQSDDVPRAWWKEENEKVNKLRAKLAGVGRMLFDIVTVDNLPRDKKLKFIIQSNGENYRFRFDPFETCDNYHSNISDMFREIDWGTVSGGWWTIVDDTMILYGKSGDYGVYDDAIAIQTFSERFTMPVKSFSNKTFKEIS